MHDTAKIQMRGKTMQLQHTNVPDLIDTLVQGLKDGAKPGTSWRNMPPITPSK